MNNLFLHEVAPDIQETNKQMVVKIPEWTEENHIKFIF